SLSRFEGVPSDADSGGEVQGVMTRDLITKRRVGPADDEAVQWGAGSCNEISGSRVNLRCFVDVEQLGIKAGRMAFGVRWLVETGVTDTESQSKVVLYAIVVLSVDLPLALPNFSREVHVVLGERGDITQQKVGPFLFKSRVATWIGVIE